MNILLNQPHHSRVHPLNSFNFPGCTCYVKRDDELSFGISGSKLRKYLSLMPWILEQKPQEAVVVGSSFSNHVLSISQLLREHQIEPVLFLLGDPTQHHRGNALFMSLFVKEENIHWQPRGNWDKLDSLALDYQTLQKGKNIDVAIVPKGANCKEALLGALTLASNILENEQELGLTFDHVFIDAGTGLMAAALILGFALAKKRCMVHVVLIADTPEAFSKVLEERRQDAGILHNTLFLYKTYTPTNSPSFGSTNATVFKTIGSIAQQEGFLTDPIFTAKLFFEGRRIIEEEKLMGNILFVHSGGALTLAGFQDQIAKV